MCGKICSGKTTFAEQLRKDINGVILSCDEIMLSLFDENLGERHPIVERNCKDYLYTIAIRAWNICTLSIQLVLELYILR